MAKKFDFLSPGIEIREIDQSFIPAGRDAEGPIIIGRTRKGPANKPVKVRNLDDFVSVFGRPVPGGNGALGDVWREGNTAGPTYASYAAQSWLASEQSPVVMVRIAGEQHSSVGTDGEAGWQVGSADGPGSGDNSTAYGLFICDEADAGDLTFNTITVVNNGMSDEQKITINDGVNSAVVLEFDNTGATSSSGNIAVEFNGKTPAQIAANIAAAIEAQAAAGNLNITVDYNSGDTVVNIALNHGTAGTLTNTAVDVSIGSGILTKADPVSSNGSLAAVLYCTTGSIVLSGKLADNGSDTDLAGSLIESVGNKCEFRIKVYDESNNLKETSTFNFTRNSTNYIRSILNTNPQLTAGSATISDEDRKTYWLGETFVDHLDDNVDLGADKGKIYGILLPLGIDATLKKNWGYHRYGAREAKSGWVFSDRSTGEQRLFRFKSMHVGEDIQRNYLIAIESFTAPTNPTINGYGSFTVCIKDLAGNTVEKYSGCNLNPASPNYVAAKIGDQYQEWSDKDKRYRTYGDFQNRSDIFYIEIDENVANGGGQGLLPAGFFGPVRPKGFGLLKGDKNPKTLDLSADFTGSVALNAESANLRKGHAGTINQMADLGDKESVTFVFPSLRMRNNGSDGGAADQARVYWGVRPKISAASNQHDPDFIDYTRALGMDLGENGTHIPTNTDFEYSFIFSLDDVSGSADAGVWSWTSGNYGNGASYTSKTSQSFSDLLDDNVRQFIMPVWGGSEGFDIKEMEPLRNELVGDTTLAEKTNYVDYSISKALDSISDPEVVPANLLVMPGIWRSAATNKMINIAESRKDILAIIDIQGDYRPRVELNKPSNERLGSVTDAVSTLKGRNLNSSYACTFYPAVQVSDNLNGGQLVWLPASIAGLGAIGKSQAQSEIWFAPAGFNRGGLGSLGGSRGPRVLQARQRLDSKERDLLYEQNINPIATFPAEGVVIFGQKTLQSDQSALDRINVRRLLLFLKSEVSAVARNLLFDQNVESTWNRFKSQVNPISF